MLQVSYAARPLPSQVKVYCDTSYLLDLYAGALIAAGKNLGLSTTQLNRVQAVTSFAADARTQNVEFVTSIFAVEEAFNKLVFQHVNAAAARAVPPIKGWKAFRAAEPAAFVAALTAGRAEVRAFNLLLKSHSIDVLCFGRQPSRSVPVLEHAVIVFAEMLLQLYPVDGMDAFHYATMRRFNIAHAAASDRDWMAFPHGTLFTN